LPKTIKDQAKEAKKPLKKGQVSIDIRRPVLTVDGFKINKRDIEDKKKKTLLKDNSSNIIYKKSTGRKESSIADRFNDNDG
jgi:hypothetical protein